jgi:hypothetical protein
MSDEDKGKDIATARSEGRAGKTLGILDSAEEGDAREQGANEQRSADAAEKTAEAAEKAAEKSDE